MLPVSPIADAHDLASGTTTNNPVLPTTAGIKPSLWSVGSLINHCAAWRPDFAARQRDSALCVSDLITRIEWRGTVYDLTLVAGRWVAIYIRVSTESQRSGKSKIRVADGYSELHQLRSCIEWCIIHGYAFRIYSDAGITSAYPPDQPDLIRSLLKAKAARYKKVYDAVWLSEAAMVRHTATERAAMATYRDRAVAKIQAGPFRDKDDILPALGRRNSRVFHRQALTQLWEDMEARQVYLVVVTDKSRLFRSADLESRFFTLAHESQVKLKGTEETILEFDISEPEQHGMLYMLASLNEANLLKAAYNSMKGFAELLRGGKPHSTLPFWLSRDEEGNAVIIAANVPLVHRIIELYLDGIGAANAISARLRTEGRLKEDGCEVTASMVYGVLGGGEIAGIQDHFGLEWPILPRIVDEDTVRDLAAHQAERKKQSAAIAAIGSPQVRAHHLFRSLAFCTCGRPCQHHDDYNVLEPVGYLLCHRQRRSPSENYPGGHAYFPETTLAMWMAGLLPHLEHLVASLGPGEERIRQRQRSILEVREQIRAAEDVFTSRREEAVATARQNSTALGIQPGAANYEQAINAIAEAIMSADAEALGALRGQLTLLEQEATTDRASARLRASLNNIANWPDLDTETQNRLLRAIFNKIVLSPSPLLPSRRARVIAMAGPNSPALAQGTMVLYLNGVDEPLPPVKMFRGGRSGRGVRLQSPEEWLREQFGVVTSGNEGDARSPESRPPCQINSAHLVSFLSFARRYAARTPDDPVAMLAQAIRDDRGLPRKRLTVKAAVHEYLEIRGLSADLLTTLDEAWDAYLTEERQRILPILARRHGETEAQAAWERYMDLQERKHRRELD